MVNISLASIFTLPLISTMAKAPLSSPCSGMIGESDKVALGRNAGMADPAAGLIERLANWIFQPVHSAEVANDEKIGSVGRPVGPLHILQNFARSASSERRASQRAHGYPRSDRFAVEQHRHLASGGDRHELRAAQAHGARFRSFRARREHVDGITLPRRAVENGLAIRSEAGRADAAAAKSELAVKRRLERARRKNILSSEETEAAAASKSEAQKSVRRIFFAARRLVAAATTGLAEDVADAGPRSRRWIRAESIERFRRLQVGAHLRSALAAHIADLFPAPC